jgi:hypothetical protein
MEPLLPLTGFPATSHAYVIPSPSGSDADALNENCVSCAMPNAGEKFSELITGARLLGVVGVEGVVGVVGVEEPPPQATRMTDAERHT